MSVKKVMPLFFDQVHQRIQGHYSSQTVVDHYVLHCIVGGKGIYQIHGRNYHLEAGDCFLLIPNVPILYQSDVLDPWVYYWIGFEGMDARHLMKLSGIDKDSLTLRFEPVEELASILGPLISLNAASISDTYTALGRFYLLCSKLMERNRKIKPLSSKEYYVKQAISLIQDSYYKNISVQEISNSIGLDRTYLYRVFKEINGITIQQYITNLRLKRACHFLATTNLSYPEIAYYCGYSSEQYFSMAFKKPAVCPAPCFL